MPTNDRMSEQRLPVVDFHGFRFGDQKKRAHVAREIADACSRFGFFYLVNHGVPKETIASGFAAAHEFFSLPKDRLLACKSGALKQNRGYQPMFDTAREGGKPDIKESFDMGFPLPVDDPDVVAGLPFHGLNSWPELAGLMNYMLSLGRESRHQ